MLNSLTLLRAMNGIYEEDVVMAGNSYFDEKQVKHLRTKRIISFALAAALILSLGIAAYAARPSHSAVPVGWACAAAATANTIRARTRR